MDTDNDLVLFNVLVFSIQHLNYFRTQNKNIAEFLTKNQALKNIFREIERFAYKSGNEKLKTMPMEILVKNVSPKNKYIETIKTFKTKIDNYDDYESLIKDCADRYRVEKIKDTMEELALKIYEGDYEKSREIFESIGLMLGNNIEQPNPEELDEQLTEYVKSLKAFRLSTGIPDLDEITDGGISKGQLWGFSGRTGKGKTWFACNLVWKIIEASGGSNQIVFMSNEMNYQEMAVRLLAVKEGNSESIIEDKIFAGLLKAEREELNSIIKIYGKCYTLDRIESIIKTELTENGNWIFFLDHFHNLSMPKRTEGESQSYLAHELQALSQKYDVTIIVMYQNAKSDYNESDTTFKGRGDTLEVTNFGFNITQDEELMEKKGFEKGGTQYILKITPIKIRRGKYKTFYLLQDFKHGGQIEEYKI